jgi:hypothetical protein
MICPYGYTFYHMDFSLQVTMMNLKKIISKNQFCGVGLERIAEPSRNNTVLPGVFFVVITLLGGCIHQAKIKAQDGPQIPACLSFQFFDQVTEGEAAIRKDDSDQIISIRTPTGGIAHLDKIWDHEQFESAIRKKSSALQEDENGKYHSSNFQDAYFKHFLGIPTAKAWNVLKRFVLDSDKIWTFESLDSGFAIIRDGRLYCLIITHHSL